MPQLISAADTTWMRVALQCDYATFFHTPIWERAVLDAYPEYRGATFQAELKSGALAIYPLVEVRRRLNGIARTYVSTFAGCYGGPIADGPISSADNLHLHDLLSGWNKWQVVVTGNPLAPPWKPSDTFVRSSDFTHILPLGSGFTHVTRGFAHDIKADIAKAKREDVAVDPVSSLDDWKRYFRIYQAALVHWGERATSNYSWALFHSLFRAAQDHPEQIRLWAAKKDGDMIAGDLVFYWNGHAVNWHGASDRSHARLSPTKLVLATAIEHACSQGYRCFDFNPSGGHAGVAMFKASFGAQPQPIERFHLVRAPLRGARYLKRRIVS